MTPVMVSLPARRVTKRVTKCLVKQHHCKEQFQLDFCLPLQSKAASCHCAKIHAMFNTVQMTTGMKSYFCLFVCLLLPRTPRNTGSLTQDSHWLVRNFKTWWSSRAEELCFKKVKWWATHLLSEFWRKSPTLGLIIWNNIFPIHFSI